MTRKNKFRDNYLKKKKNFDGRLERERFCGKTKKIFLCLMMEGPLSVKGRE